MAQQGDTVRQALEASLLQHEGTGNPAGSGPENNGQPPAPAQGTPSEPAGQPAAPAQQSEQGGQPASNQPATPGQPAPTQGQQQPGLHVTPPTQSQRIAGNLRPPQAWKPEIRQHWAALPAEIQVEVTRREREMAVAMQETAQARQFVDEFRRVSEPFRHIMALEGDDPITSFGNYLRTAAILRSGGPHEKAIAVAQAVRQYGVDIQALDNALAAVMSGQQMPPQPQQPYPQYGQQPGAQPVYRDPRVDQLLQLMQQQQQDSEQALQVDVQSEIDTFAADPKNEFFAEVSQDVGDILSLAAKRNMVMDLPTAYARACQMSPRISQILSQRAQAARQGANPNALAAARAAASSLPANNAPSQQGQQGAKDESVRGAIESAIEQLST